MESRPIHPLSPRRMRLISLLLSLLVWALGITGCTHATPARSTAPTGVLEAVRSDNQAIDFASVDEARAVLGKADSFTRRLSDLDRSLRLRTPMHVTSDQHREHARQAARPWSAAELDRWRPAVEALSNALKAYYLPLPTKILIVRTDGSDELGANYTRASAIILPRPISEAATTSLTEKIRLLAHELFHIASRYGGPQFVDTLYDTIGFQRVTPGPLPKPIARQRLTNPDAMGYEHALLVNHNTRGHSSWCRYCYLDRRPQIGPTTSLGAIFDLRLLPLDAEKRFIIPLRTQMGLI